MNSEMFVNLVWPSLAKAIEDKGFTPCLLSNNASDIIYIEMHSVGYSFQSEKQFRDIVIDLLTQYHIPFVDKSDTVYACILVYLNKIKIIGANND